MSAKPQVPERSDAVQNRAAVLAAAEKMFAEHGSDASMDDVARAAGVGMGTVYRRFPNKEALIDALTQNLLDKLFGVAESALDRPDGTGLEYFLEVATEIQMENCGSLPRLWKVYAADTDERRDRLRQTIAQLVADAKQYGRIREELTPGDVTVALWGFRGVIESSRQTAPTAWRRYIEIVIAGLRPGGPPLKNPPVPTDGRPTGVVR